MKNCENYQFITPHDNEKKRDLHPNIWNYLKFSLSFQRPVDWHGIIKLHIVQHSNPKFSLQLMLNFSDCMNVSLCWFVTNRTSLCWQSSKDVFNSIDKINADSNQSCSYIPNPNVCHQGIPMRPMRTSPDCPSSSSFTAIIFHGPVKNQVSMSNVRRRHLLARSSDNFFFSFVLSDISILRKLKW